MAWLYAAPSVALANVVGESVIVGAFTTSENAWELEVLVESVAVMLKLNIPPAAGVPEIVPDEPRLIPTGKAPLVRENVYGPVPPDAVRFTE